ncbi:hypothetical protein HZR84_00755 [Hyphobacterium sp. CCMP332]|nr:hypothetical protein HZR84_00755 [Hyphobacterium sp. CCMP332]
MRTFKLFFAIIAFTFTANLALANNGLNRVLIRENANHMINLKTELDSNDTLRILIKRNNKELILEDEISNKQGLISKSYDFKKARFGDYSIAVYINDKLVKTSALREGQFNKQDLYILNLY